MITIHNATEQRILNTIIYLNPETLPVTFKVECPERTSTISIRRENGKYILNEDWIPMEFPYNKLIHLLDSVYDNHWDKEPMYSEEEYDEICAKLLRGEEWNPE